MNIEGLEKTDVLIALYSGARVQGMGFLQADSKPLTKEEAQKYLDQTDYFDYLRGRVMKISLKDNEVDTRLYNRDNGNNAAERIIEQLRKK